MRASTRAYSSGHGQRQANCYQLIWRFALSALLGEFFTGCQNHFQGANGSTYVARINFLRGFRIERFQFLVKKIFSFFILFSFQFIPQFSDRVLLPADSNLPSLRAHIVLSRRQAVAICRVNEYWQWLHALFVERQLATRFHRDWQCQSNDDGMSACSSRDGFAVPMSMPR